MFKNNLGQMTEMAAWPIFTIFMTPCMYVTVGRSTV